MTVSTDAIICYGISIPESMEGAELPWFDEGEDYGGETDWWRETQGYKPPFELYDEHGNYLNGEEPARDMIDQYFQAQRDFDKEHPMPVAIVRHCSDGYTLYIIAAPGTVITASRGDPVAFDPTEFTVSATTKDMLLNFCQTYGIDIGEEMPNWWLASYWG